MQKSVQFFSFILFTFLLGPAFQLIAEETARDPRPQKYNLTARASEIDSRAREYPKLRFVFDNQGKPADLQHAAVDTSVASRRQLVIWLMGHNQGLFDRLSSYGLHAIQVHYANGWFGTIPADERDSGKALGDIRLEAATGQDHSPLVDIAQPDGMMERSLQFVKWLARENPQGQWNQFLTDDEASLKWDQVIMCGISHGSTTAARFAKHQSVARVVMFSGPRDQFESWQAFPSATPANRYFGFTHVLDGGWTGDHYCRSWELLELHEFGPLVVVEDSKPPYGHSRRLLSTVDVNNDSRRAHSMVVPGRSAAKTASGDMLHEPVWRYLFTSPVDETGPAVPTDPDCEKDLK
ncbi:BPSS1187 family protein [Rubinisphaera margarita]|uniref:BPSS1187 family protein n=1 Tax=Rubinisphaera margarita TaxID=2909586 RepID=UPI001EE97B62|nr:hypothetical protein [Rubinisphaera margarita]MCG6156479.1 hypothetical protein [Rubinisphaera margarita]